MNICLVKSIVKYGLYEGCLDRLSALTLLGIGLLILLALPLWLTLLAMAVDSVRYLFYRCSSKEDTNDSEVGE